MDNSFVDVEVFKNSLEDLSLKYNLSNYNQFNLFRVMYKMTEEKNLHSRFVAFLLNPIATHGQGNVFLKLFLKEFEMSDFDINGVTVLPDEHIKKEEDNIDILITNAQKQTIIIENKIFAGDSNKIEVETDVEINESRCTHKYQLPRYYNKIVCSGKTVSHMLYLTIDGKKPSFYEEFPFDVKQILKCKDYLKHITNWLTVCLNFCPTNSDLNRSIAQYKQAIFEFLNDYKLALELKDISAQNLDEAYSFWEKKNSNDIPKYKLILEQYKHVKWHTIHEFYSLLKHKIETTFDAQITDVSNEKITALSHKGSKKDIKGSKKDITSMFFEYKNIVYYVCNDQNGFSIGVVKENKNNSDFELLSNNNEYAYFDFSNWNVFILINTNNSDKLATNITEALELFIKKYKNS